MHLQTNGKNPCRYELKDKRLHLPVRACRFPELKGGAEGDRCGMKGGERTKDISVFINLGDEPRKKKRAIPGGPKQGRSQEIYERAILSCPFPGERRKGLLYSKKETAHSTGQPRHQHCAARQGSNPRSWAPKLPFDTCRQPI